MADIAAMIYVVEGEPLGKPVRDTYRPFIQLQLLTWLWCFYGGRDNGAGALEPGRGRHTCK